MSRPTVGSCWVVAMADFKDLYLDCASCKAVWTQGGLWQERLNLEKKGEKGKRIPGRSKSRRKPCWWPEHQPVERTPTSVAGGPDVLPTCCANVDLLGPLLYKRRLH